MPAVPALAWAAVNVPQTVVAGKAIALLSEIGGIQGVAPICQSLRRSSSEIDGVDIRKAAREALLKLLPTVGRSLTMDDAISLWEIESRIDKRFCAVIVSAWEASGIEPAAVAEEILSRKRAKYHTSKGMDHLNHPPPSPMNWRLLTECELLEPVNGVVNMQRKSEGTLWAEEHQTEIRENQKRMWRRKRKKGRPKKALTRYGAQGSQPRPTRHGDSRRNYSETPADVWERARDLNEALGTPRKREGSRHVTRKNMQ